MQEINILYGPPGTGKTHSLLTILEKELKYNSSQEIAFCSFTRKAVNEGRTRAMQKFNLKQKDFPYFRTLHSLAFQEMNFNKSDLLSFKDYRNFSYNTGMHFLGYYTEELFHNDDKYLFYHNLKRNSPSIAKRYDHDLSINTIDFVEYNFKKYKEEFNKYDYTDLIETYISSGSPLPVKVAIIDEAQDLTSLQWEMIKKAYKNCQRIYIAGDDDQAIYEWNGADINYFMSLDGNKEILKTSYRLKKNILDFSKGIVKQIKKRVKKDYNANQDGGEILYYNNIKEIEFNRHESWYLLARNNYFLNIYRDELMKKRILFKDKNDNSICKKELKKIDIWESIRRENRLPTNEESVLLRHELRNGYNIKDPWYCYFNMDRKKIDYYKDIFFNGINGAAGDNLHVNTIHGVKGGEAENVVILMDITATISNNLLKNLDSELRCLYVACTRAKNKLHIVNSRNETGEKSYQEIIRNGTMDN
jgi:superfamily I DNA/RNA helicase